jgi:hypothetical protein
LNQAPEKAKPGRKPLAPGDGKTARLQLKVLPAEKAELVRRAEAAGQPLQVWMVARCLADTKTARAEKQRKKESK